MTSSILNAKPIYEDVNDAPFHIGCEVKVIDGDGKDETFNLETLSMKGTIEYYEYQCGCGQTYPHDPMIGVRLSDNSLQEFWKEELEESK